MDTKILMLLVSAIVCVRCKSVDIFKTDPAIENSPEHKLIKRFINPSFTAGNDREPEISKIRAKRGYEEDCEKLQLCKLHARSNGNFFAAFELYFVNRENARLWDHHARSLAECNRRYSC